MRRILAGMVAAAALSAPARAADEPLLEPPGEWVQPLSLPSPDPAEAEKPFQTLLLSGQTRHGGAVDEHYFESAVLVQDPQALSALGTVALPWNPQLGELVVHKVQIVRNGTIVDLLAKQRFTTIRRESNLENATLDGVLTAVMQPEGLSVGDILLVAFTLRSRDPAGVDFLPERMMSLAPRTEVGRLYYRDLWPSAVPVRWNGTGLFSKPATRESKFGKELVVDLKQVEAPEAPRDAPPRFNLTASLDVSAYRDWTDVSRLFAPLYDTARRVAAGSPLQAEIAAIAKASADPRIRAMAALRLVEDKVRYVALAMGDGGYVPASADQTWLRKFGDCKGKTALLLALLDGLGIEAEPVLVNGAFGDALPERLPMARLFDHIIVRARIGGRSYWLDGTAIGDRDLEALASSSFRWGLPLRRDGSGLEAIPAAAPPLPLIETSAILDASKGFHRLVPFTRETVYRGTFATHYATVYGQLGREKALEKLRESISQTESEMELDSLDFRKDDAAGTFTMRYAGKRRLDWTPSPTSSALRYKFEDETIEWDVDFKRPAGPFSDAPFLLPFPTYLADRQVVILPGGGTGFALDGRDIDETVSGAHVTRRVSLENGRAVAVSTFRTLKPEIAAAEARAGAEAIKRINASDAYILSPAGYEPSGAEMKAILEETPKTARGFVDRGFLLMDKGRNKSALADFDRAIQLDPEWSLPHANKGVALVHQRRFDEAEQALAAASRLNDGEFVVHQGYGLLHEARDKPAEAVAAYTRSLHFAPANSFTLLHRATAYEQLGQLREALADVQRVLAIEPGSPDALWRAARLHAQLGEPEKALAQFDRGIADNPDEIFLLASKGDYLLRFGRKDEAAPLLSKALALAERQLRDASPAERPGLIGMKVSILTVAGRHREAVAAATEGLARHLDHIDLLAARCMARAAGNLELDAAARDCRLAAELDPERLGTAHSLGLLELRREDWDSAIATYTKALSWEKHDPRSFYGRGIARSRKGDKAGAEQDFANARRYGFDVSVEFDALGLRP